MQSKLEEESAEHGDILQETFQDSYNNLTIKSIFILKYYVGAADNLGNKFLLKTDDDSFVHLEALWDLAKSRMAKKSNNLIGYLQVCEIYKSFGFSDNVLFISYFEKDHFSILRHLKCRILILVKKNFFFY